MDSPTLDSAATGCARIGAGAACDRERLRRREDSLGSEAVRTLGDRQVDLSLAGDGEAGRETENLHCPGARCVSVLDEKGVRLCHAAEAANDTFACALVAVAQ
jgi:hypothetical protein